MDWTVRRPRAADIDPHQLVQAMVDAGWRPYGGREGFYARLMWPGESHPRGRTTLVALDPAAQDFEPMLDAVLHELIDAADLGQHADAVLTALATAQAVDPHTATDLDEAMHTCWLEGNWRWMTGKMTTPAREAAVAAVLRYDRSMEKDPADWLDRSTLAWWEN